MRSNREKYHFYRVPKFIRKKKEAKSDNFCYSSLFAIAIINLSNNSFSGIFLLNEKKLETSKIKLTLYVNFIK